MECSSLMLFGSRDYLKQSDLDQLTRCSPFSSFLNYLAYDSEMEIYLNQDSTLGMMWECLPVIYALEEESSWKMYWISMART